MNRLFAFVWLFGFLSIAAPALAQPESAAESAVAASVGDDPVEVAELQRLIDSIPANKKPAGDLLPIASALMLEEVVNQRLVVAYARRAGDAPSAEKLAKAKREFQLRRAAQGRKESITAAELERQVLWGLVWDRYLSKYCTPKRRETWFQNHHRDLDGTELVVSHILLRPAAGAGPKEIEALAKRAESIREEITSGKIDFAAAAEKYSDGPSRKQGGRLGKVRRHDPMPEPFSRAAFELSAGQISPPVRSSFGVHLIRCNKVVPGTKKVTDLTAPIDAALARELLEKLSDLERKHTHVTYTTLWPHFREGTQELAK